MNVQSPLIQVAAGGTCVDVDFVARRQILEGNTTFQHIGHNGGNYSKANTAGRQRPTKSAAPPPGGTGSFRHHTAWSGIRRGRIRRVTGKSLHMTLYERGLHDPVIWDPEGARWPSKRALPSAERSRRCAIADATTDPARRSTGVMCQRASVSCWRG
jgi:hypothetical protein